MRIWKQISACCLAAVLAAGPAGTAWAGSPEFARTAEEWARLRDNVMEYDELAGLIHEYNVTVHNNQVDYNKKRQDGDVTSDEIAQAYRDAADEYWSEIDGEDPVSDAGKRASARQAEKSADNNVEDLTVYRMTYVQTEANLVLLEAVKGAKEDLHIEAPLIIYDTFGQYSPEAAHYFGGK